MVLNFVPHLKAYHISCGSMMSATQMSDSGENPLFGSSILLLLSD